MDTFRIFAISVRDFFWTFLRNDVDGWITVFTLVATLVVMMVGILKRGRLMVENDDKYGGVSIVFTNTSIQRPIQIKSYGYKDFRGRVFSQQYRSVVLGALTMPSQSEKLPLYHQAQDNIEHPKVNDAEIFYFYVQDSAGKIYKVFPRSKITAHAKRFIFLLRDFLCSTKNQ